MSGLPQMVYNDGIKKTTQIKFGGYDHNLGAAEGSLWDMENLTGDYYPLLATRGARRILHRLTDPHGFYARDGLFWVDGDGFFANGERKGTVTPGRKIFCALGDYLIIFPDKCYYNAGSDSFGSLEAEWSGSAAIKDGTYNGEPAAGNTIQTTGSTFPFSVGEAVTITGCTHAGNNKTVVIEEVSEDKRELRFLENCFENESGSITVCREVPDMDFLCENENRLWGCKGDTIFASALGNPFVWNDLRGLATGSFAVDVGSAGDFTACCSYLGYPIFFKEDHIYKVYGSKPSNFQVMGSASLGVEQGSHLSLAVAGEKLFYLSRVGVVSYSGGMATSVARPFGEERYHNAVGGSDGVRYYCSMESGNGKWSLFVFDTRTALWYREDETKAVGFCWDKELYLLSETGEVFACGSPRYLPAEGEQESEFESYAEFGDFIESNPNEKGVSRLHIRVALEEGATLIVKICFDSADEWHEVKALTAERKRSVVLPIIPRRCDHWRLRLEGTGQWKLYSMAREFYAGSDLQGE